MADAAPWLETMRGRRDKWKQKCIFKTKLTAAEICGSGNKEASCRMQRFQAVGFCRWQEKYWVSWTWETPPHLKHWVAPEHPEVQAWKAWLSVTLSLLHFLSGISFRYIPKLPHCLNVISGSDIRINRLHITDMSCRSHQQPLSYMLRIFIFPPVRSSRKDRKSNAKIRYTSRNMNKYKFAS